LTRLRLVLTLNWKRTFMDSLRKQPLCLHSGLEATNMVLKTH
jgi:hypothetical protein